MRPASPKMQQIIDTAIIDVQRTETRTRTRKAVDQKVFEETVSGVLCAVAHHHLLGLDGGLITTRSNDRLGSKSRYKSPLASKVYPAILDALASEQCVWIQQSLGVQTRLPGAPATTIRASKRLEVYLEKHRVDLSDIKRITGGEVIHLKSPKHPITGEADLIDYADTDQTNDWRERLNRINEFFEDADILVGDISNVDPTRRRLRRIFNNARFDHGGRLEGGFWQQMSKTDRFETIEISGEPVVELDYQQMSLSVAYGLSGHPLPDGDLYALDKLQSVWDDTVRKRVKQYTNALIHRPSPMKRRPTEIEPLMVPEGSTEREITAMTVRQMILNKHKPIEAWFETGRGMELMFHESEILLGVLEALMSEDIVGLPIHDAVLVPLSAGDRAEAVMKDIFKKETGGEVRITQEAG